jgi:hypothetical protein
VLPKTAAKFRAKLRNVENQDTGKEAEKVIKDSLVETIEQN